MCIRDSYNVVQIDPGYEPKPIEQRDIFGIRFEQGYNDYEINESLLNNIVTDNKELPESAKHDMILALITLKYTQSNSVCYVKDGMTIGVGAGQQSRIHCTRLAGNKADNWFQMCIRDSDLLHRQVVEVVQHDHRAALFVQRVQRFI